MFERDIAEASAFALDRRNFDYLPDEQIVTWRTAFLAARNRPIPGPKKLIVELLNSCNLDCPICRVGQHGVDLTRMLPLSIFEMIVHSVSSVKSVRLNGLGEPTQLPNFEDYLSILRFKNLHVELVSNGTGKLTDYCAVADLGGHILVSWDAAEPQLFERLRRPARWTSCVERLGKIACFIAERRRGKCSLIFTLQEANIGEFCRVVEFAAELGLSSVQMNVAKTRTSHWITENRDRITADIAKAAKAASDASVAIFTPDQIAGTKVTEGSRTHTSASDCVAAWEETVIRWNGDVQVCNMFNPYTYGNIHRHSFETIWHNAFADVFREKLNRKDCHPYCRGCAYMPSAYE
jgi:radical SAM protein with 4Fe4S-binding SPASM domain